MRTSFQIISVVGARPQFIKLAPLTKGLSRRYRHVIIHTGQHYDDNMSDVFFKQLEIPAADINLHVGGGRHGAMTGRMLTKLERVFVDRKPDMVLIYGDTNSTLAGALAASKLGIPVGHVEAGLRSFVDDMPEEINRRVADQLSQLLFCPTTVSINNLKAEGVRKGIVRSGDLMYELLDGSRSLIKKNKAFLGQYDLTPNDFVLLTLHRAANVDSEENLLRILDILGDLGTDVLFPIHPRTRHRFRKFRLLKALLNIGHVKVVEPMGYLDTLSAAFYARAVMTDSGGLQKEAVFLQTPVLTLRNETEWLETLKMGNRLVGLSKHSIIEGVRSLPKVGKVDYRIKDKKPSVIIVEELARFLRGK